ncbi:MAG: OmpA family protein, partial [Acidobacteria bacterium]|nr:OmpA family protein [Acidobacteriota bacterium]
NERCTSGLRSIVGRRSQPTSSRQDGFARQSRNCWQGVQLEIGGHTDATGDPAKNMSLSQQRADSVRKILVSQGVDASRLSAKGYGSTKPIGSNDTLEGKAQNRRVEFVKL